MSSKYAAILEADSFTVTSTGITDGPDLRVDEHDYLAVDATVTLAGASPTFDLYVDRKDGFGNYIQIAHATQLTATGAASLSIGPGCTVNVALGALVRVRAVVGGTVTSAEFTVSVQAN